MTDKEIIEGIALVIKNNTIRQLNGEILTQTPTLQLAGYLLAYLKSQGYIPKPTLSLIDDERAFRAKYDYQGKVHSKEFCSHNIEPKEKNAPSPVRAQLKGGR